MRVRISNLEIDKVSFSDAVATIIRHASSRGHPEYVVTPNAQHVVLAAKDSHFQKICHQAFLNVADGVSLLWSAKLLGTPLLGRVNGTDLFERLCAVAAEEGLRIFLLGGRPGAADAAKETLLKRHQQLQIVGAIAPSYDFAFDKAEQNCVKAKIMASSPDLLFVGLGVPKQEIWIYENYHEMGVPVTVAVGVSFELVSGIIKRASPWAQKRGLEWLFRVIAEPRRLIPRYAVIIPTFLWLIVRQRFRGK